MFKFALAAVITAALIGAPAAPAFAQTATEKSDTKTTKKTAQKSEKKLTPQQQKMKDCASKWGDYKNEKKVKGRTEYRKFMSSCLKG